jgi:prepilin-type N-terminal cleavage/methylation domain-containing protein
MPLPMTKPSSAPRGELGFTLVEIAIVLVIIGLLIGGILKGQEIITNARIKRIESDAASVSAALHSYQDRYRELPGDDPQAEQRFDAIPIGSGFNGNGDSTIGDHIADFWDTPETTPSETNGMWAHLRAAGLVGGGPTDRRQPTNAYGGLVGIQHQAFADELGGGGTPDYFRHGIIFGKIPGKVARIIDTRTDDGVRNLGTMRALPSADTPASQLLMFPGDPTDAVYTDDEVYDIGFRW